MRFNELVDEVKSLPYEEKEELRHLLEKYLIEERRSEIKENAIQAKAEYDSKKLIFSSDIKKLKEQL